MSLVAYGDSDDGSSDSEPEESTIDAKSSSITATTTATESVQKASNSEESGEVKSSFPTEKRSKLSSFLPKPQNSSQNTVVIHSEPQRKLLDLKALQDDDDEDEIIDVEEEYVPLKEIKKNTGKPAAEQTQEQKSVGSLFSRMPSPWSLGIGISIGKKRGASDDVEAGSSKKGKQPVRIAAPTLADVDSDEETDDNKAASKTVRQPSSGSGLSSLLPKPKHSVTLTASNPNKPAVKISNRALIPHTLTKKPAPSKETKSKKKKDDGNNSDDDDNEPVSFFTFADKKDIEATVTKDLTTSVSSSTLSKPIEASTSSFSSSIKVTSVPEVDSTELDPVSHSESMDQSYQVPYQSDQDYDYSNAAAAGQYYDNTETTTTYYQPQDTSQSYAYGGYDQSSYTTYYETQPSYSQYQETAEPQTQDIDLEKIQRLQGKKNRKEQINIIDINAADQTSDTKVQLTNLTAEQFAHKTSKKKGNMPSSQQRRKHQITYLAFQAKEREFELQQQWASNHQTKRQTQAKYGF